jgi:DNA repair exonuclease SbcCD nuclease subunit
MTEPFSIGEYEVVPFHFGDEFKPYEGDKKSVAVIHELIWQSEPFINAPKSGNFKNLVKQLRGFDYIFCGDNHEKFITEVDGVKIVNHGSLMRLTAKQMDYTPSVWVLYDDGSVESIDIPCADDKISREHLDVKEIKDSRIKEFVASLKQYDTETEGYVDTSSDGLDFVENLKNFLASEEIDDSVIMLLEESSCLNLK